MSSTRATKAELLPSGAKGLPVPEDATENEQPNHDATGTPDDEGSPGVAKIGKTKANGAKALGAEDGKEPPHTPAVDARIAALKAAIKADEDDTAGVPNLETLVVPVGKPGDFFRVHPDQVMKLTGFTTKDINKTFYAVPPKMRGYLADYIHQFRLFRCIDMDGNEFVWPIQLPDEGEEINTWPKSCLKAAEKAKEKWIKLVYVKGYEGYKLEDALGEHEEPVWADKPFDVCFGVQL